MKRYLTVLLAAGALVARADVYYSLTHTNWPPLPFAPVAGELVTQTGPGRYVFDDSPAAAVFSRALGVQPMGLSTNELPPGFDHTGTNTPDPWAWMGTWVRGLPGPKNAQRLPKSPEAALWTIVCTNVAPAYREYPHQMIDWFTWTKVCPGDKVYVLWPYVTAALPAGWGSLVMQQRGTNDNGNRWTNTWFCPMDNTNHDRGNWAEFTVPQWPIPAAYPKWIAPATCFTNPFEWYCTNNWDGTNIITTNKIYWGFCYDLNKTNPPSAGPIIWDPSNYPVGAPEYPSRPFQSPPILITDWPPEMPTVPMPPLPIEYPLVPCTKPITLPPLPGPYDNHPWYHGQWLASGGTTNIAYIVQLHTHGIPGQTYIAQSSTNLASWTPEGTNTLTFNSEGVMDVILLRATTNQIPCDLFWRLQEAP